MKLDLLIAEFVKKLDLPSDLQILVCLKTCHFWAWQLTQKSFKPQILQLTAKVLKNQIASELQKCLDLHYGMDPGVHTRFPKVKIGKIAEHVKIVGGKHLYTIMKNPLEEDIAGLVEIQQNLVDFGVNSAYFTQAADYVQALAQVSGAL